MAKALSNVRSSLSWKYVLIIVPLILISVFDFVDTETTKNPGAKIVSIWSNLKPLKKPKFTRLNKTEEYVVLCVAVKDQSRDIPEFFKHHYITWAPAPSIL